MYFQKFFKDLDVNKIKEELRKEGWEPVLFENEPGFVYERHQHPETKLLVFLKGSMKVSVGDETFECRVGDKLIIPGNTPHKALVGDEGCTFFWSEKII